MLYAMGNIYFSLMMQVRLVNRANFNSLCEVNRNLSLSKPWRQTGEIGIKLHSLISALDGSEWSTSHSSCFTHWKEACCPLLNIWCTNTNSKKLCLHFVKILYIHYEAGHNMFNTNLLLYLTKWFSHRYYHTRGTMSSVD
jgi:hypothetical protein